MGKTVFSWERVACEYNPHMASVGEEGGHCLLQTPSTHKKKHTIALLYPIQWDSTQQIDHTIQKVTYFGCHVLILEETQTSKDESEERAGKLRACAVGCSDVTATAIPTADLTESLRFKQWPLPQQCISWCIYHIKKYTMKSRAKARSSIYTNE